MKLEEMIAGKTLPSHSSCRWLLLSFFFLLIGVVSSAEEEGSCTAEELYDGKCGRQAARVLLNGETFLVEEESKFKKGDSTYPPSSSAGEGGPHYYILNEEKPILYLPNFLDQSTAEELIDFCVSQERFSLSHVGGYSTEGGTVEKKEVRTSESCPMVPAAAYLKNPRFEDLREQSATDTSIRKVVREVDLSWDIAQRAAKLIGVEADTVEALQVVRYTSPDAEYKLHHDHGGFYGKTTEIRPWTMLIFLNDVSDGGHTAFPELGIEVIPRRGDAIVWSNTKTDEGGETVADPDMVHMGKPPSKEGVEKYAVNVWFGETDFATLAAERRSQEQE